MQIIVPDTIYSKDEQTVGLYREIDRRLSALPGVEGVGLTSMLPVQCNCNTDWIRIVGRPFHGEHNEVTERDVSPGYLTTLKGRLVRGRWFDENDGLGKPRVIVINEALAAKYFPGEDPIGKTIGSGDLSEKSLRQVVGVIANVREGGPDEELWPSEYFPIFREPDTFLSIVVRTEQDEKAMLPTIVAALHQIDDNLGVYGEQTMTEQIESSQSSLLHQFASWLVGGFAVVAFLLGVIGLYGVVAYSVSRRTREIGVRMALGAQRASVYKMVMRQAGWLTAMGIGIGLVCAVGARMLDAQAALWRGGVGRTNAGWSRACPGRSFTCGKLPAGASCRICESHGGAEGRVGWGGEITTEGAGNCSASDAHRGRPSRDCLHPACARPLRPARRGNRWSGRDRGLR